MKLPNKRTFRTVIQTGLGLIPGIPLLIHATGVDETTGAIAVILAVSAAATRVMAIPQVQTILDKLGLGTAEPTPAPVAEAPEQAAG